MVYLQNIKQGEAFTFTVAGQVYIRCRGGYRPGLGGELVKIAPDQKVIRYTP